MADMNAAREALKKHFGFGDFLDGQAEVVEKILSGEDGLVVMPTGGGKSLCYQLPALVKPGVTLVVSPLIALMKDQVDALLEKGIPATLINSTLTQGEQRERMDGMCAGEYKLVYIAPERFKAPSFMRALKSVEISLFAVDESHCLSQWGHDFRPDYMKLGHALEEIGRPQCVALTATATPVVREDILQVLQLKQPFEIVSGFARPNLALSINQIEKQSQKYRDMKRVIAEHKTGIVYCSTRKRVEEVSEMLASWGVKCIAYHGGMSDDMREKMQGKFIKREVDVAVATNAFGMGIDRSDVRFVIHFEVPGSIEAYYQEAGRAGRDGENSACVLYFNYADTRTQEFFIDGNNPTASEIRGVYQYLLNEADGNYEVHRSLDEVKDGSGIKNGMAVGSALGALLRARVIERFDVAGSRVKGTRLLQPDILTSQLQLNEQALEEKDKRDRAKLKSMIELCYSQVCRQQWILEYFGEDDGDVCGSCDVCTSEVSGDMRGPEGEEDLHVRKALSGVARMSRKQGGVWMGRFGKGKVVLMLTGSKSQAVMSAGLDRLSTYGLLKEQGSAYISGLLQSLQDAGLLKIETGEYPLLTLTTKGDQVMRGKATYRLVWPASREVGPVRDGVEVELTEVGFDPGLYEALKDLRNDLAAKEGVPAYVIFSNKTLEYFTRLQPKTLETGRMVRGVGEAKAQKYLPAFIKRIVAHLEAAS